MRRQWILAALVPVVVLAATAGGGASAGAQTAPAPSAYCTPGAAQYDPADLRPGGSKVLRPKGVRTRRVRVDGVRTPVLESGPRRAREAVVFLHGVLGSSQDWVDLLPRVGRSGRRAVAFDLPGFGRASDAWGFRPTFAGYTRWFSHALTKLGVRRAHLVLHDIGAPIAFDWALRHPRRTGRIALIDGGVLLSYTPASIHVTWATPGQGEQLQQTLTRGLLSAGLGEGQVDRPLPRTFLDRVYDDFDRETRCAVLGFFRGAASMGISDTVARKQAAALRDTFGRRRRVLVVWGAHDPYLKVVMAARQRDAFPGARVRVLEHSGHWPFEDDPRAVRRLVVPFLR